MANWENFLQWQTKYHPPFDNEFQNTIKLYLETQIPMFEINPFQYLVDYRKSQMIDWTGLENEDYCIPNDLVNNYLVYVWKISRPKYNINQDYSESHHVSQMIKSQAIKELKAKRPKPIFDIKLVTELTESQFVLAKSLFLALFNQEMPSHHLVFVSCDSNNVFALACIDFKDTKITHFGVHPQYRKNGYGEYLLKFLKSKCSELYVECSTEAGIAYFEKYAISKIMRFTL